MNKNNQLPPLGMDLFEGWEWGRLERAGSGVRNAPGSLHCARQFAGFTFTRLITSVLTAGRFRSISLCPYFPYLLDSSQNVELNYCAVSVFLISLQVLYLPCRNHI